MGYGGPANGIRDVKEKQDGVPMSKKRVPFATQTERPRWSPARVKRRRPLPSKVVPFQLHRHLSPLVSTNAWSSVSAQGCTNSIDYVHLASSNEYRAGLAGGFGR